MGKTYYSLEFKLQVLVALDTNNGNLYVTAKQFGVPRATLSDWHQNRKTIFEQGDLVLQERRLRLSQRMELIINQIVDSMPKKVAQARLGNSARALSIMIDLSKAANEAAKAVAQQSEGGESAREKLARLLDRYAAAHQEEQEQEQKQQADD